MRYASRLEGTISPDTPLWRMLSRPELAQLLGVSVQSVYCWWAAGRGPRGVQAEGRRWQYRLADVVAWANGGKAAGDELVARQAREVFVPRLKAVVPSEAYLWHVVPGEALADALGVPVEDLPDWLPKGAKLRRGVCYRLGDLQAVAAGGDCSRVDDAIRRQIVELHPWMGQVPAKFWPEEVPLGENAGKLPVQSGFSTKEREKIWEQCWKLL